jgi:hypothetical protein
MQRGGWSLSAPRPGDAAFVEGPLTFALPLADNPSIQIIQEGAASTAQCPGTGGDPQATAGFLCVYVRQNTGITPISSFGLASPTDRRLGVQLTTTGAAAGDWVLAFGTYAVRAA